MSRFLRQGAGRSRPLIVNANFAKAYAKLDRAVDQCYRAAKFNSDWERVEFLFRIYEKLAPLTAGSDKKRHKNPRQL